MQSLSIDELHTIELNILLAFDLLCQKYQLKYSLGAGTMIGAVRHKGFIPWDDDIDIFMTREEYEKFTEIVLSHEQFIDYEKRYYVCLPDKGEYRYPFIKIIDKKTILFQKDTIKEEMGVWIDIFPIDYCGDYDNALAIAKRQMVFYRNFVEYYKCHNNDSITNICKNIFLFFFRIFHRSAKKELLASMYELASNPVSDYSGTLVWTQSIKDFYPNEYFDDYTYLEFEGHQMMVFKRYDEILRHRYGNYMKLPPKSQRFSHKPEAFMVDDIKR